MRYYIFKVIEINLRTKNQMIWYKYICGIIEFGLVCNKFMLPEIIFYVETASDVYFNWNMTTTILYRYDNVQLGSVSTLDVALMCCFVGLTGYNSY